MTEEPLTVYACHCADRRKRSGSAFSLSVWVNYRAIEVTEGEPVQHETQPNNLLELVALWRDRPQ